MQPSAKEAPWGFFDELKRDRCDERSRFFQAMGWRMTVLRFSGAVRRGSLR